MGGINVLMLRRDFTVIKKRIRSKASHTHYGNGSYLNMEGGILATQDHRAPPVLIFQEGNAVPKGVNISTKVPTKAGDQPQVSDPWESVKWGTWYTPMLRGLNRERHGKALINFGKWFNLKTFPFWLIGLALLAHFLGGGSLT